MPVSGHRRLVMGWITAAAVAALLTAAAAAPALAAPGTPAAPGTAAPAAPPGIVAAPTQVAHTSDGDVGYRTVGSGSPVLLITGFSGTMDDWAPSFVDALAAAHHRVVVFDNAGVGDTAALPGTLTISAMARQASALISALRLGRPAVLGWSMGGMIAQALAVQDPGQTGPLVLAATQAGTGRSLPIPAAAQAKAASGNPAEVLSVLFPADQAAAAQAYAEGVLQYPNPYTVPAAVQTAQEAAIAQWMAGQDPAGRRLHEIRSRTLVADGTEDALDPVGNAWLLASGVRGAALLLYPDAGHAFLFQDAASFGPALDRFLSPRR